MTKDIINKLPKTVRGKIEGYRQCYTKLSSNESRREMLLKDDTRRAMASYIEGLRDAGLITERERQIIFVYMTV